MSRFPEPIPPRDARERGDFWHDLWKNQTDQTELWKAESRRLSALVWKFKVAAYIFLTIAALDTSLLVYLILKGK